MHSDNGLISRYSKMKKQTNVPIKNDTPDENGAAKDIRKNTLWIGSCCRSEIPVDKKGILVCGAHDASRFSSTYFWIYNDLNNT